MIFMPGYGFAPIKAIIEHALFKKLDRTMISLGSSFSRPVMVELPANGRKIPTLLLSRYYPIRKPEDTMARTGFVHQAILDDFEICPDLTYACGAPVMCEVGHKALPLSVVYPRTSSTRRVHVFAEALAKTGV
jgi:CDP-4-dehydro-6-deoxyglucose reductase